MLILYRNYKQSIKIGDDIEIKILNINGDQVDIGIKAPKKIRILREEIKYKKPNHKKKITQAKDEISD